MQFLVGIISNFELLGISLQNQTDMRDVIMQAVLDDDYFIRCLPLFVANATVSDNESLQGVRDET